MTQTVMIAFMIAAGILTMILMMSLAETKKKVDKLQDMIANLAANQVKQSEDKTDKPIEDLIREAQVKNFEEWINNIVEYTPYTRAE